MGNNNSIAESNQRNIDRLIFNPGEGPRGYECKEIKSLENQLLNKIFLHSDHENHIRDKLNDLKSHHKECEPIYKKI